jgi:uncharacterized OB-fold protein
MEQKSPEELIRVPFRLTQRWREPAGIYVNRFFLKMRDKKELWAIKCPQCGAIWLPPEILCAKCNIEIEDKEENWVKLGNKGTLIHAYHVTGAREVDPSTGWQSAGQMTNPIGFIRPDGGNEWTLHCHALDAEDLSNVLPGMRVEAVWRPRQERTGTIQDIKFWRIVEE